MSRLSFFLIANVIIISGLYAQTTINGGVVYGLWTKLQSPYHINGEITIPNDSTLTIEPGVVVEFQNHYALQVQGQLLAIGTENDTILFTINDTTGFSRIDTTEGGWNGIQFYNTPTDMDSSRIEYCRMQYGKAVAGSWPDNSGGAISILNFGKILISNCLFIKNTAGGPVSENPTGGAIHMEFSDVRISDCTFANNHAFSGGAVQYYQSNPVVKNCTFLSNTAHEAGGLQSIGMSTTNITDCSFINNRAEELGGAIRIWDNTVTHLENVVFSGNSARDGGGIAATFCELYLSNCDFLDNTVTGVGGGITANLCTLYVDHSKFLNNSGDWAGGIHSWENDLSVTDCRFEGNIAKNLSGGIHSDFTDLVVKNTIFSKNSSSMSAGIHSWFSDVNVSNCSFEENTADHGGGLHGDFSHIRIDSSNFIKNTAQSGAGVHAYNSDLQINKSIFDQNDANVENGGAILYTADSTIFGKPYQLSIKNNQFLKNTAAAFCGGIWIEQVNSDISLIDIEIDKCDFYKNHADRFGPLRIAGNISDIIIRDSEFRNNTSTRWVAGPGIMMGASAKLFNIISASNYATFTDSTKLSSCATVATESQAEFFNCTFTDTSDAAGYGISMRRQSEVKLTNCIIWGCGDRPVSVTTADSIGCNLYINYCDIENGRDSIFVSDSISNVHWGMGNLAVNPYFADVESGEFQLSDSSLCIGAGVNCYKLNDEWQCAPEFDLEGNIRPAPVGSNADMGAYEHELGGPSAIKIQAHHSPNIFKLNQNYPNPFNPVTAIGYQLSTVSDVDLSIYNILGQKIVTLVSGNQPAGVYKIEWDAGGFASGMYFYRLTTSTGFIDIKKLILLK